MQWLVPSDLKENLGTDKPKVMHYPLFQSEEVHKDFIDWSVSYAAKTIVNAKELQCTFSQ
jgi:hypothetical protein